MSKIKVGVMGAYRGSSMINYCAIADNAEVVAICDKWEEGLAVQRELHKDLSITYYNNFEDFIKHDMDAVAFGYDRGVIPRMETSTFKGDEKLINVAKASLKELLTDYEDYLRVNGYELWREDSDKFIAMRKLGVEGSSQSILDIAKSRSLDTVANMAIILLKQEVYLLHKLLTSLSEQFLDEGGFKEKMHRMRVERRGR